MNMKPLISLFQKDNEKINIKSMLKKSKQLFDPIRNVIKKKRYRNYKNKMRDMTITRKEFLNDLKFAIDNQIGYAVGKIGFSEQHWMYYEIFLEKEKKLENIKKFESELNFHGLMQEGVFPASSKFYLEFNQFYIKHVKNIDCLGICYRPWELEIIKYQNLKNKFILYHCHEPFIMYGHPTDDFRVEDRFNHKDPDNNYLPYFKNKRILIICPFASLLQQRGNKEIFEAIWSKIGKVWFYPKSIESLEIPYGFEKDTQKIHGSAINMFNYITAQIEQKDFDIALIAAAGLAIPIASHIKSMNKVAIDLGGHLQIIFGVLGKRWLEKNFAKYWTKLYYNESWINMPSKYKPQENGVCDRGAYW